MTDPERDAHDYDLIVIGAGAVGENVADYATRRGARVALVEAELVGGDLHEHLGQLIAYARANKVTPPWSK